MLSVDLDVTGMDEMQKFFDEPRPLAARQQVRNAVIAAGELIKEDAKSRIHSISGDLADSLQVESTVGQQKIVATIHHGQGGAHDHLVEYGHMTGGWNKSNEPVLPHPYMWPAYEAKKEEAFGLIKGAVAEAVRNL